MILCDLSLFADHDVQDHVVGMLHSDRSDAAEILNGLLMSFSMIPSCSEMQIPSRASTAD